MSISPDMDGTDLLLKIPKDPPLTRLEKKLPIMEQTIF
jgi:hypothetical protein